MKTYLCLLVAWSWWTCRRVVMLRTRWILIWTLLGQTDAGLCITVHAIKFDQSWNAKFTILKLLFHHQKAAAWRLGFGFSNSRPGQSRYEAVIHDPAWLGLARLPASGQAKHITIHRGVWHESSLKVLIGWRNNCRVLIFKLKTSWNG